MRLIKKMRRQDAVYWVKTGVDSNGQPTFADPIEVKCRWEDCHEQYLSLKGETQVSNAKVYVDRVMKEGDVLWKGLLVNLTNTEEPFFNDGAFEINKVEELPTLKADDVLLTVML